MSTLKGSGRAADETFAVSGSDDLAEEFIQLRDADFQKGGVKIWE